MIKRYRCIFCLLLVCILVFVGCSSSTNLQSDAEESIVKDNVSASEEKEPLSADSTESQPSAEGSANQDSQQTNIWKPAVTTDAFGDVTENSVDLVSTDIIGDFSNTATAGSELKATVTINPFSETLFFDLYEYNSTLATYLSSDTITLKCKIDDVISEFPLRGEEPNGTLQLANIYQREYNYKTTKMDTLDKSGFDLICEELLDGNDVRCIITIGSSQYNFTIGASNLNELCKDKGYNVYLSPEFKTARALSAYLAGYKYDIEKHYEGYTLGDGYDYIISGIGKQLYKKLDKSSYDEVVNGYWKVARFVSHGDVYQIKTGEDGKTEGWNDSYQWSKIYADEDYLCLSDDEGHAYKYIVYELLTDSYLLVNIDDNGKAKEIYSYIMVKCDEKWTPINHWLTQSLSDTVAVFTEKTRTEAIGDIEYEVPLSWGRNDTAVPNAIIYSPVLDTTKYYYMCQYMKAEQSITQDYMSSTLDSFNQTAGLTVYSAEMMQINGKDVSYAKGHLDSNGNSYDGVIYVIKANDNALFIEFAFAPVGIIDPNVSDQLAILNSVK